MKITLAILAVAAAVLASVWCAWPEIRKLLYMLGEWDDPGFYVTGMFSVGFGRLAAGLFGILGGLVTFVRAKRKSWTTACALALAACTIVLTPLASGVSYLFALLGFFVRLSDVISLLMLMIVGTWLIPQLVIRSWGSLEQVIPPDGISKPVMVLHVKRRLKSFLTALALIAVLLYIILAILWPDRGWAFGIILLGAMVVFRVEQRRLDRVSAVFWAAVTVLLGSAFFESILLWSALDAGAAVNRTINGLDLAPVLVVVIALLCSLVVWANIRTITGSQSRTRQAIY